MQYAYITEFCQFDLNEHIVRCRFTEMGVMESYCNSVESSSIFLFVILSPRTCLLRKNYWTDLHQILATPPNPELKTLHAKNQLYPAHLWGCSPLGGFF